MIAFVVVGVYYMFKWWWRSSYGYTGGLRVSVDGPRNVLKVSVVVLVVLWTSWRYEWQYSRS